MKLLVTALALMMLAPVASWAQTLTVPAGTRIFGELQDEVTSDVDEFEVGDFVTGRVWRNVTVDGQTVIAAGAPMVLQVSDIQKRRTFGRSGNVEIRAVSVMAVDGTEIFLDGGYDKKGESRVVLSSTLAALVAWPTLFLKGKEAVLPPGTIFDAAVPANTNVAVAGGQRPTLRLSNLSDLSAEILYDALTEDSKELPISIELCDQPWVEPFAVVAVNEAEIESIEIEVGDLSVDGDCTAATGLIDLKDLSKEFAKGINRFTIAIGVETTELMLDVEM